VGTLHVLPNISLKTGRNLFLNPGFIMLLSFRTSTFLANSMLMQIKLRLSTSNLWAGPMTHKALSRFMLLGKDEKWAITVLVAISESSELLPFQAIFKRQSSASLPNPLPDDPELKKAYKEAMELGFHFEYAGDTYWSTLETMKSWVDHILAPYFMKQKALLGLQNDHECILQLDVWSVHASEAF
jgi:hypothetical protein